MSSVLENKYLSILDGFRNIDLQHLLNAFGQNKTGRKSVLKARAINLLKNNPPGFKRFEYLSKILEIHHSVHNGVPDNNYMIQSVMQNQQQMMSTGMQQIQQQGMLIPRHPQQTMQMTQDGMSPVISLKIRGTSGYSNNLHQQSSPRIVVPTNILPINQQLLTSSSGPVGSDMNAATSSGNSYIPTTQTLANIGLKKLPFYEIQSEVIKPINLIANDKCSLKRFASGKQYIYYLIVIKDFIL